MAETFRPRSPDYVERVRTAFEAQPFMGFLGAELASVEPGRVGIRLAHREALTQQHGFFHGGLVGTLADNAGGFAAFSLMAPNEQPLSVEFKVNLMAPARGDALVVRGEVLRDGRTLKISRSEVYAIREGSEHHCATSLVTVIALGDFA